MCFFASFARVLSSCFCFSFSPNMFEMKKINPRIIKEKTPFWLAGILDDNAIGLEIVLKISNLPSN